MRNLRNLNEKKYFSQVAQAISFSYAQEKNTRILQEGVYRF